MHLGGEANITHMPPLLQQERVGGVTGQRTVRSHSGASHPCSPNHTGPYSQSQRPSSCWGPPQCRWSPTSGIESCATIDSEKGKVISHLTEATINTEPQSRSWVWTRYGIRNHFQLVVREEGLQRGLLAEGKWRRQWMAFGQRVLLAERGRHVATAPPPPPAAPYKIDW